MNGTLYYHFLDSKYAIHDLERKMIRVSTLDTLNDPFELLPYLRYGNHKKVKNYLNVRKKIQDFYGLLCFSKTWREPLLWSHYADKHRGIALGFQINTLDIFDVIYDSNPLRRQFDLTSDPITNKTFFLDLAKFKYIKWQYEEESRILIKLEDCIKIDGNYFIEFKNILKVKEIRLGANYDYNANDNKYLIQLASANFNAEIIPCRLERQGYKINRDGSKARFFDI